MNPDAIAGAPGLFALLMAAGIVYLYVILPTTFIFVIVLFFVERRARYHIITSVLTTLAYLPFAYFQIKSAQGLRDDLDPQFHFYHFNALPFLWLALGGVVLYHFIFLLRLSLKQKFKPPQRRRFLLPHLGTILCITSLTVFWVHAEERRALNLLREKCADSSEYCDRIIIRHPNDARAYFARGRIHKNRAEELADLGRAKQDYRSEFKLAEQDFEKALSLGMEEEEVLLHLGSVYFQQDKDSEALKMFNQAIHHYPSSEAYFRRGFLFHIRKEYEKALPDYHRALTLDPLDFEAWYHLGNLFADQGQCQQALGAYTTIIENPDYYETISQKPLAALNRGFCFEKLGKREEALQDYSLALQLNPRFQLGYYDRAALLEQMKGCYIALPDYQKVIELEEDPDLVKNAKEHIDFCGRKKRK